MTLSAAPFDLGLPSPIATLLQLRARGSEAVVRDGESSTAQRLMAPSGPLEDALWAELGKNPAPKLLVLTGSAGSGKSAIINHLLARQKATGEIRIGAHLADATHADFPDQEQAERLADFFSVFADNAEPPDAACRLVAMNTGMALRFFRDLQRVARPPQLGGLETLLRRRLGLPGAADEPPSWLSDAVLVVNLDQRPTAGQPGDLFPQMLRRLDPDLEDGVLEGTPRCRTCEVRDWCWPMANVSLISSPAGRDALNAAAGDVALAKGRQLSPRALWDAAAQLALSGLKPPQAGTAEHDPCFTIAYAAREDDEAALIKHLACNAALQTATAGTLVADLAERDPGFAATREAHDIISEAGLDPEQDGKRLLSWLAGEHTIHPAVRRAASAVSAGRATPSVDGQRWGRVLARAAWLAGELTSRSSLSPIFTDALQAQAAGVSWESPGEYDNELEAALSTIERGLAAAFGVISGPEHYYPTSAPPPGAAAELLVEAKLVDDGWITIQADPVLTSNPRGAHLADYRPLTLSLKAAGRSIAVDYPLWTLLVDAESGTTASAIELERFLALRQAIRTLGIRAAAESGRPLLVRERGATGRRFRIVARGNHALRATEVL